MKYILGLDISLTSTGYAVCRLDRGKLEVIDKGRIRTYASQPFGVRLMRIKSRIDILLEIYPIDLIVKEGGFTRGFSTQQIFRAVGVCELACAEGGHEKIEEIAPTSVKKYVAGYGKATKEEVALGVMDFVGEMEFESDDVSDAVAVVIAYLVREGVLKR